VYDPLGKAVWERGGCSSSRATCTLPWSLSTGVTLHYAERGDRKGETIIFLHAYTDSWFAFSRVLALLSPSYHAFAPDEGGHGDSDKPGCCYTADDFTADVDAFMDAVGIEEATLGGDS
jgi:non-heme chloroperoxidase